MASWLADFSGWLGRLRRIAGEKEGGRYRRDLQVYRATIYLAHEPAELQRLLKLFPSLVEDEQMELVALLGRVPAVAARNFLFQVAGARGSSVAVRTETVLSIGQDGTMDPPVPGGPSGPRIEAYPVVQHYLPHPTTVRRLSVLLEREGDAAAVRGAAAELLSSYVRGLHAHSSLPREEARLAIALMGRILLDSTDSQLTENMVVAVQALYSGGAGAASAAEEWRTPALGQLDRLTGKLLAVVKDTEAGEKARSTAIQLYSRFSGEAGQRQLLDLAERLPDHRFLDSVVRQLRPTSNNQPRIEALVRKHILGPNFDPRNGSLNLSLISVVGDMGLRGLPLLEEIVERSRDRQTRDLAKLRLQGILEREQKQRRMEEWEARWRARRSSSK